MHSDPPRGFETDVVQVKPLTAAMVADQAGLLPCLAGFLVAGCQEEQRYLDEGRVLVELGCRDLQDDLYTVSPGWFVAWNGSEPVGLVRLTSAGSDDPDAALLAGLYVLPEWRCRGVGRSLVLAAAAAARAQGRKRLLIYVASKSPARHFYSQLGLGAGVESGNTGFVRYEWPLASIQAVPVLGAGIRISPGKEKEMAGMRDRKLMLFMLRAVAAAMGISSVALGILQPDEVGRTVTMLGIGLACLAVSTLND